MPVQFDRNGKMLGEWGNLDAYFSWSMVLAVAVWFFLCFWISLYDLSLGRKVGLGMLALLAALAGGFALFIVVLFIAG